MIEGDRCQINPPMSGKAALVVDILYRELIDPEIDLSERIQQVRDVTDNFISKAFKLK